MCGRITQTYTVEELVARFMIQEILYEPSARYNLAPTQTIAAVMESGEGERRLQGLRWGLVPSWAKDLSIGNRLINARAETVSQKNSFKNALRRRRCIVPVSGYYEWQKQSGKSIPFHVHRPDGKPLAMAGLWESWQPKDSQDEPLETCTLITTTPSEEMAKLHHRMPAILQEEDEAEWLSPNNNDADELCRLLGPLPEPLTVDRVSDHVNSARNEGPECIEPMQEENLFSAVTT